MATKTSDKLINTNTHELPGVSLHREDFWEGLLYHSTCCVVCLGLQKFVQLFDLSGQDHVVAPLKHKLDELMVGVNPNCGEEGSNLLIHI